nr:olfactory receptor 14A16-like [Anas platyrhynchos]
MPVGGDAIQKKLERLERWSRVNLLKFNKEKCKVLHLGQGNSNYHYRFGDEWFESSCAEKDMVVVIFEDLDMIWQGALAAQEAIHPGLHERKREQQVEFLLLPFADTHELQLLHFGLFLGIYLAALLGNGLILTAIACNHRLHTPMYFFLFNLALLDLGSISTTVPKAMANSLWDTRAISYLGCATQIFMFALFVAAEFSFLTIMSYDRYVAICKPLHYRTIMGSRTCVNMAAAVWGSTFLYAVLHTANTFSLPLCQGNALDQFFCEIPQILKLSCSDAYLRELGLVVVTLCLLFLCFVFIVLLYVQIFKTVLRIPSQQGRHKAFSTCLPHLAVVSLFISTGTFAYLKPSSMSSSSLNLMLAVLYAVVPPAVNPLIYSMRNQELKDAVRKMMTECF